MSAIAFIAKTMFSQARQFGKAQHTLQNGLTITLMVLAAGDIPTRFQLSLSRQYQQASQTERDIIQKAFGIPAHLTYKDWKFDYINGYGVQRITWSSSLEQKRRLVAQGHLAPGWSMARWRQLMKRYGVNTTQAGGLGILSIEQLDQMIGEIYEHQK